MYPVSPSKRSSRSILPLLFAALAGGVAVRIFAPVATLPIESTLTEKAAQQQDTYPVRTLTRSELEEQVQNADDPDSDEFNSKYEDATLHPQTQPKTTIISTTIAPLHPHQRPMYEKPTTTWRFPPSVPFLEAISTCETLACLRDAHHQPRGEATFNFPHFMIAGWSKSATTSLYKNLNRHPQILPPHEKEPEQFTDRCTIHFGTKMTCNPERVKYYIRDILKLNEFVEKKGQVAPYEATPRIAEIGPELAEILHDLMPWLKIIASMREPISRGMSKFVMLQEKQPSTACLNKMSMADCMLWEPPSNQRNDHEWQQFGNPKRSYYSFPLKSWLDNYPAEQLMWIQYEEVIGEENGVQEIRRLKEFLGLNADEGIPGLEELVSDVNCRKCRIQPEGWKMQKNEYQTLIKKVMPDVLEVVRLVDKYKLGNGTRWLENWQKVWDDNLATCSPTNGTCSIKLS